MKKLLIFLLIIFIFGGITSCTKDKIDEEDEESVEKTTDNPSGDKIKVKKDEWVFYWYLCGSDLETRFGLATEDLEEMFEVDLPKGITVLIQTGGANSWRQDQIRGDKIQRFVYNYEGFKLVEELASGNMGNEESLYDFLTFAKEKYPGKRTLLNIWNHGGGSLLGAAFDENYGMDSLILAEMYGAIERVYGSNLKKPPIDIIGFDACLMATMEVANNFKDFANYLVASQDLEPGIGWDYKGVFESLAENPRISPLDFSKAICDSYYKTCSDYGYDKNVTLSVTDLSKMNNVFATFDDFICFLLSKSINDQSYLVEFIKSYLGISKYGSNETSSGFTNMGDLGQLVNRMEEISPHYSLKLQKEIEEAVVYKVSGDFNQESSGLSIYCPFDNNIDNIYRYSNLIDTGGISYLYKYIFSGDIEDEALSYLDIKGFDYSPALIEFLSIDDKNWDNHEVFIDENGELSIELDHDAKKIISDMRYKLYKKDPDIGFLMELGSSKDISFDESNNTYRANFQRKWGYLDGSICSMDLIYEDENYTIYSIPIYLNGEGCYLKVYYDKYLNYYYLGEITEDLYESGAASKEIKYLKSGDFVEPIQYVLLADDFWGRKHNEAGEGITVTPETSFYMGPLEDGEYELAFYIGGFQYDSTYSSSFKISIYGDNFYIDTFDWF